MELKDLLEILNHLLRFYVAELVFLLTVTHFYYKVAVKKELSGISRKTVLLFTIASGLKLISIVMRLQPWYAIIPSFYIFAILLLLVRSSRINPDRFEHDHDSLSYKFVIIPALVALTIVAACVSRVDEFGWTLGSYCDVLALTPQYYLVKKVNSIRYYAYLFVAFVFLEFSLRLGIIEYLDFGTYSLAFYTVVFVTVLFGCCASVYFLYVYFPYINYGINPKPVRMADLADALHNAVNEINEENNREQRRPNGDSAIAAAAPGHEERVYV